MFIVVLDAQKNNTYQIMKLHIISMQMYELSQTKPTCTTGAQIRILPLILEAHSPLLQSLFSPPPGSGTSFTFNGIE